jgi:hypothetical protein
MGQLKHFYSSGKITSKNFELGKTYNSSCSMAKRDKAAWLLIVKFFDGITLSCFSVWLQ